MTTHFECEGSIWALESRFWKLNLVVFGESFLRHFLVRKKSPRFLDHEDVKLFLESSKFDSRKSTLKFAKQILRYFFFLSFWFLSKNQRSHFLEFLILEFLEIEVQIKFFRFFWHFPFGKHIPLQKPKLPNRLSPVTELQWDFGWVRFVLFQYFGHSKRLKDSFKRLPSREVV